MLTTGHAIVSAVTRFAAHVVQIVAKCALARPLLCTATRRIIVTHIKPIDLIPYLVAFSLGLCVVASTAGCTEERAKAVAPPEVQAKSAKSNVVMQQKLEEAIELSSVSTTKPIAKAAVPVESPKPAEERLDKESATQPVPAPIYEATLLDHDGLLLKRLKTTSEIENREPVTEASTFSAGIGRVYAFMEVRNDTDEEQVLTTNFIGPQGQVRGGVEITIPPKVPRWRTWAYSSHVQRTGQWEVEVRTSEGSLLGTIAFDVE